MTLKKYSKKGVAKLGQGFSEAKMEVKIDFGLWWAAGDRISGKGGFTKIGFA